MNDEDLAKIRYRQHLILSALRNLLSADNKYKQNDYLISKIDREL